MLLVDKLNNIQCKQDFLCFLKMLENDFKENNQEWANISIENYLESIRAWITDYSLSPTNNIDWNSPNWSLLALIFYSGKFYE